MERRTAGETEKVKKMKKTLKEATSVGQQILKWKKISLAKI